MTRKRTECLIEGDSGQGTSPLQQTLPTPTPRPAEPPANLLTPRAACPGKQADPSLHRLPAAGSHLWDSFGPRASALPCSSLTSPSAPNFLPCVSPCFPSSLLISLSVSFPPSLDPSRPLWCHQAAVIPPTGGRSPSDGFPRATPTQGPCQLSQLLAVTFHSLGTNADAGEVFPVKWKGPLGSSLGQLTSTSVHGRLRTSAQPCSCMDTRVGS